MSSYASRKRSPGDETLQPIQRFSTRRLTRKEKVVKEEIDTYHVSDVDNTEVIYVGNKVLSIYRSLELPDAECKGLTYKQRLVSTESGDCMLLVRWKPDRQMRRTAPDGAERWFVEKQLFPPDLDRLFSRLEKRMKEEEEQEEEQD